ncbi:hypothetical protein CMI39_02730 [Candidatus Pacearchaeota archaeon]|jgi:hypothetical protein|nr:hypothetical protein [Candidatus Pacearchaeota archaeon]|tara:strand:- start:508 stop:1416 length:909 start_codon:yes stop_codon:yes gene_type:complete
MRLKFVDGKQKELIKEFKNKNSLTWKELANFLKIKGGRLKAYVDETSLIPEKVFKKLDKDNKYFKFIIEKKDNNWGRKKGGKNSLGNTKKINIPKDSEQLAEFYGAMLGDGNSHRTRYYKTRNERRGVYVIRIIGDSKLDKKYHLEYLKPLIEKLFNVRVNSKFFKNSNTMLIEAHGTRLVEFLEKKGFPPGNKIKNKLNIPRWIKENKNYLKVCLRGLYDTDGSVYKLTGQNSHQICFTNFNQGLLQDVRESLLELGVNCSKISKKDIYITKKSELRKFLKLVGFRNFRHLKKVKMWKLEK